MKLLSIILAIVACSHYGKIYADEATQKQVMFLSGKDNEHTETWDFYCTGGRKSGYWTTIEVPSHWEQQGFGTYNYGRDYVTYGKNFEFAKEKGIYRKSFTIPKSWEGKTIRIVFEGSMTDTEVKINGEPAGDVHQGSFYRFRYDITDKVKFDEPNQLEATVAKWSENKSVNRAERYADYWIFGGIYRPVYLEAYPEKHIDWFAIDAKADGSFAMHALPEKLDGDYAIEVEISDAQNRKVGSAAARATAADSVVVLETKVDNPLLWTAETPHLYKATVFLKKGNKTLFQTEDKFGFRTIEIRNGDGVYINGAKVKFKGINRHCFWPETGRSLNARLNLNDVKLIKEMNMNAVRTAHYPPDKEFLDYCDSLGLYVIDELGGWQDAYDTESGAKLVRELVMRDVNHPSIIFWSNGNEGGHNTDLDDDYAMYDPSERPVIHAHHRPGNDFNGIDCNHYESYYSVKEILSDSLIYMPTEFLHCQDDGGCAAGLNDYWEVMWNAERSAGGFLWVFSDEGLVRTDWNGAIDVNRVNAPDGIVGPRREKEGSFFAVREIFSPVYIGLDNLPGDFNGKIPVENRYHFTNFNQCKFRWEYFRFNDPSAGAGHEVLEKGEVSGPDIPPLQTGSLDIPAPANPENADALTLTAFDPSGAEIYAWTWKLKSVAAIVERLHAKAVGEIEVEETDSLIVLTSGESGISISKADGMLKGVKNNQKGEFTLKNGPALVSGAAQPTGMSHGREADGYRVEASYSGAMKKVSWKMFPGGVVKLEYEYELNGKQDFMGVSFDYPESYVISVKWLGDGPYRVWKNRLKGVRTDVWEKAYNNTETGQGPWRYPEFKGYHAHVAWMEFNTVEGKFVVASPDDDMYVRLFDFHGLHGYDLFPKLPVGNISFLDGIPPIGTMLATNVNATPDDLGPESEKNKAQGIYKRALYFFFEAPEGSLIE